MNPLSVGNIVSAGLRIYRDNFKRYFKLAFIGYLWVLVPVYGWAKYSTMMGVISRLAFKEVAEQPEAINDAQRRLKPKMWDFFATGLLVALIFLGALIPYFIILTIISMIVGAIFNGQASAATVIGILLIIVALLLFIFGFVWLVSRLLLVELPLAIEDNVTATSTISRSWQLTKNSVGRIQLVVFLAFLVSAPVGIVINLASAILQVVIGASVETNPGLASIGVLLYIFLVIVGGALIIPFWQAIKAVVYYDLRMRREGMDIELRK
ncbi:hypothetical protein NIES4102_16230 [Chondrocystis sp. NIES-4102]|nr:hypothetical protein NIES4102_16230 [Chondrocystis sp. NIES-4102]